MQSHGVGNLANHVTIDKIVLIFGHGSAKCRETIHIEGSGAAQKVEPHDLVSGHV